MSRGREFFRSAKAVFYFHVGGADAASPSMPTSSKIKNRLCLHVTAHWERYLRVNFFLVWVKFPGKSNGSGPIPIRSQIRVENLVNMHVSPISARTLLQL